MLEKLIEINTPEGNIIRGIKSSLTEAHLDEIVICVAGFARAATTELKFKFITAQLKHPHEGVFRYDFPGLGLSEGNFAEMTIEKSSDDLKRVIDYFQKQFHTKIFTILAHSLGAAILGQSLTNLSTDVTKIAVLAPALNQRDLQRYWFVQKEFKNKENISWSNYTEFLDEQKFQAEIHKPEKFVGSYRMKSDYFIQSSEHDYTSPLIHSTIPICHVHGGSDRVVPLESVEPLTTNKLVVKKGDHELEKPWEKRKWLKRVRSHLFHS